jgi:hypothetical protein
MMLLSRTCFGGRLARAHDPAVQKRRDMAIMSIGGWLRAVRPRSETPTPGSTIIYAGQGRRAKPIAPIQKDQSRAETSSETEGQATPVTLSGFMTVLRRISRLLWRVAEERGRRRAVWELRRLHDQNGEVH